MKGITLLVIASVLVLGVIGVVFAAQSDVPAQVVVNAFTSVTITPCASPLSFGSGNPGTNDLAVACQNGGGAVTVTNNPVSNGNINVDTKGTNFTSSGNNITVNKIEFDESNAKPSPTALSEAFQASSAAVTPGSSVGIWYWLDIPSGQAAGTYSGTLSVKGQ